MFCIWYEAYGFISVVMVLFCFFMYIQMLKNDNKQNVFLDTVSGQKSPFQYSKWCYTDRKYIPTLKLNKVLIFLSKYLIFHRNLIWTLHLPHTFVQLNIQMAFYITKQTLCVNMLLNLQTKSRHNVLNSSNSLVLLSQCALLVHVCLSIGW